jgi:uncharacterized alkaline shock family protein YloU
MLEKKAERKFDARELQLPETLMIRDIENRVFQTIVLQCLSKIEGIGLAEGNLFDAILGRSAHDNVKGIFAEQDMKNHSVNIRVEIRVAYGVNIPQKAEEIQSKVAEEITALTGLHVSCVHVVFKGIIPKRPEATPYTTAAVTAKESKTDTK